jgi:hypothetical protein
MEAPMRIIAGGRPAASVALVTLAAVLVGCTRSAAATPSAATPSAATPSAEVAASPAVSASAAAQATSPDCVTLRAGAAYGVPSTLDDFHSAGTDAIVGTVGSIGKAHWDTPDQSPPADVRTTSAIPLRPLAVSGAEAVVGSPNLARLFLRGGTVGCDTMTFEDVESIQLVDGQRYLFLVYELNYGSGPSGDWSLGAAWPVADNGRVATPVDGDLTIGQIRQGLRDGWPEPAPLPEPSAGG